MVIERTGRYRCSISLPLKALNPGQSFIKRKYVWIPIVRIDKNEMWFCIKLVYVHGQYLYKTIIAFRASHNMDCCYKRVVLSAQELFELLFLDDQISFLINKILESS